MSGGLAVFETALGACGVAWRGERIVGVLLPEGSRERTLARLALRHVDAAEAEPPPAIAAVIADIIAMLAGEPRKVDAERLDLSETPELNRRIYAEALSVPYGRTTTYGEIARSLGDVALSQAVGQAMGSNPVPILVPCHRVLGSAGKTGGFSGGAGVATKIAMLNIERAAVAQPPSLFAHLPFAARQRL